MTYSNTTWLEPLQILLIEGSSSDVFLTTEALKLSGMNFDVHVAHNRSEVTSFLRSTGDMTQPPPDVILFGLNPFMDETKRLLAELKSDQQLMFVPLILLAGSPAECDFLRSAALPADAYLTRPLDTGEFTVCVDALTRVRAAQA